MDNYHVLELVGEGSFGKVYKGRKKYTSQIVALKFIPKLGKSEKELKGLRREIEIMRGLKHDNIIELLDSFDTDKEVVVVTDFAEGELFQILEDDASLPEEQVQVIAAQLVSALYYLHSHRILHRDMKPQNILLGKGGVIKLCDFGFARGMSANTLVLTSIKGTPLYMSPELVEEKPYDHTADLWALGCILYELFVGSPPFYTNSIFQLVTMIIKDPVKWPKTMSPVFKDFLQGLLNKNPKYRLAWPDLLHHPFIADKVKVNLEDTKLPSPFTQPLTSSMIVLKEEQSKSKANPPGTSKILARARKKAIEDVEKNRQKHSRLQAWDQAENGKEKEWDDPDSSKVPAKEEAGEVTQRSNRISTDYKKEYPSIEVEGRTVLNKKKKPEKSLNMENVKLDGEETDSEDEWQRLIDLTDPDGDPEFTLQLFDDVDAIKKLHSCFISSSVQVRDCMLEGASRLRSVLRVITNMVTLKCDVKKIVAFCNFVQIPDKLLELLKDILSSTKIKQQPWAQQILIDIAITINAYFACEITWVDWKDADVKEKQIVVQYNNAVHTFWSLIPSLVNEDIDEDLRLLEQTLLCVIFLSGANERGNVEDPDKYFSSLVVKHKESLKAILLATKGNPEVLKQLTEIAEGNIQAASERMEQIIHQAISSLVSVVYVTQELDGKKVGKKKVADYLADTMIREPDSIGHEVLLLSRHPLHCCNTLKIIYSCVQASPELCQFLDKHPEHMESLLSIIIGKMNSDLVEYVTEDRNYSSSAMTTPGGGKVEKVHRHDDMELSRLFLLGGVELADMEVNTAVELVLYILSVIVIQQQCLPAPLASSAAMMVGLFLESTLASHTAAAALLFSQLVTCGVNAEVQPYEMLQACLSVFTDLDQICVRPPFEFGVLDGLLMLLNELLCGSDSPVASLYIESGIWDAMWHRIAQGVQVINVEMESPMLVGKGDSSDVPENFMLPDWSLISPQGLMASLQMAVTVFTKETYQCLPNLATSDSILMLTLVHFLHPGFLQGIHQHFKGDGPQLVEDIILAVTQMGCFPFAVDTSDELLAEIQHCLYTSKLVPRLLGACVQYLSGPPLETPIGLLSRLVLGNVIFVEQLATAIKTYKAVPFLNKCLSTTASVSVICDIISMCSHLVRVSPEHLDLVKNIFTGSDGDYLLLSVFLTHNKSAIKSRTCSLLGNIMRHNDQMYSVIKHKDKILDHLLSCLRDSDSNVRKCAAYAVGNACYHSGELYPKLRPAVPHLVDLLHDPITKTRANAASACGNLGMHSSVLFNDIKKCKLVAHLLEAACHDAQTIVQINAMLALRSLCQQQEILKDLLSLNGVDKLTPLLSTYTPRDVVTPRPITPGSRPGSVLSPRPTTAAASGVSVCAGKLLRLLQKGTA
ncbi:serine/threonine-protein kinase 36-like isoform X3 [Biomphalaria glabrata]|uniref:non-specific serine/threonine protein kinase n=1 Tax=Biomphalaria glabrata TaxID=6526 RepID=A0A9W2YER1_BIOGL|nr:serine/threonine-protein kinase 36-like isoform X3 [Biomphalaria glabrata]